MKFSGSTTHWIPAAILMASACLLTAGCGESLEQMGDTDSKNAAPVPTAAPSTDGQAFVSESAQEESDISSMGGGGFGGFGAGSAGEADARPVAEGVEVANRSSPEPDTEKPESLRSALSKKVAAEPQGDSSRNMPAPGSKSEARTADKDEPMSQPASGLSASAQQGGQAGKDEAEKTVEKEGASPFGSRQLTFPEQQRREITRRKRGNLPAPPGDGPAPAAEQKKPAMPAPADAITELEEEVTKKSEYQMGHRFMLLDDFEQVTELARSKRRALQLDLQPGEELWVIARASDASASDASSDTPGCGALMATLPNQTKQVPVPLKHTAVEGDVDGYIATVNVTQQFHNPYDSKIEAVYVFPLPQNAAVNEFVMTVGDRKIRGIIREREKAEQIYAAARSQGHVASLMTQERANIFTQKVANIEPGKQIDIDIRYFNTLQYDDGAYEFVFPMVVGPRFNPPATSDGVGAVAKGAHGTSGQKTEVQYLAPSERSGHDISLSLNISAGVEIEDVHCVNHAVNVKNSGESERQVELSADDTIPNKDFVLRYKVAGDKIKTAMLTHEDQHGKYFTMMLYPPADLEQVSRSPMEMVFVLDCSGSMKGKPIAQAKAAISHALQSLTPRDTFQIIRFSNNASQLGAEPVLATEENIQRGLKYLTSLNGSGGTHMIEGIKAALGFPHDEGRFRLVSFMTDGYIGNEQKILGTMYDKLGASRVFSFGVGSSPNRMLMNRMAVLGRGAATYLSLNDDATEIMDRFNRRISHPAMTDLTIDWGDMRVADVYPQRMPDLIVGRPVVVTGRFKGEPGTVSVNGRVDMEPTSFQVSLDEDGAKEKRQGIAAVWARLKIKDMMNVAAHAPEAADEIRSTVTKTALAYNLMSNFTAFVAVDSLTKTEGQYGTTVAVPVPVPEGVKYETTVGGN